MKLVVNQGLEAKSWDDFLLKHPKGNVLQSWVWGEFQEALGNVIWRFRVVDNQKIIAQLLVIKLSIGFGKYIMYAPRDTLINKLTPAHHQHQALKLMLKKIKELAHKHNVILFRIEPPILKDDYTAISIYASLGFIPSKKSIQPSEELIIDISKSESEILANMKPKTRYNIKLASKKNIEIAISDKTNDIKIFNQLNQETSQRGHFKAHSDNYYYQQLETLGKKNSMELLIAYWQDTPLSAILITFFGSTSIYLHGASSWMHKDKMANHAIQWAAIQQAKEKKCLVYNLGGIDYNNKHPNWAGITRFKSSFGGKIIEYAGTLELPLNQTWHKLYKFINLFKR